MAWLSTFNFWNVLLSGQVQDFNDSESARRQGVNQNGIDLLRLPRWGFFDAIHTKTSVSERPGCLFNVFTFYFLCSKLQTFKDPTIPINIHHLYWLFPQYFHYQDQFLGLLKYLFNRDLWTRTPGTGSSML